MSLNKMSVHMMGLMYFNACGMGASGKKVLVPNGRREEDGMPLHYASIFVEKARCEADDWWPEERKTRDVSILNLRGEPVTVPVIEFRIPERTELTFPDGQRDDLTLKNLEQGLPHLKSVDRNFVPDFNGGDWIAQVALRGGSLQAFTLNGGIPVVQWATQNDGPLKIVARRGDEEKSITVRPQPESAIGAEVVFSNTPDLLEAIEGERGPLHVRVKQPAHGQPGHSHELVRDEPHHFALYGKIRKPRLANGPALPDHRRSLPFGHALMKAVGDARIQNSCTPTCC